MPTAWSPPPRTFAFIVLAFAGCANESIEQPVQIDISGVEAPATSEFMVQIQPVKPTADQSLEARVLDRDGNPIDLTGRFSYTWAVDGALVPQLNDSTVPTEYLQRDQQWQVRVVRLDEPASDPGQAWALIGNAAPSAPEVEIHPTQPVESVDALTCSFWHEGTDTDNDAVDYELTWLVDGKVYSGILLTTDFSNDTVPAGVAGPGEHWQCAVRADDGKDQGPAGRAEAEILAFDLTEIDPYVRPDLEVSPYPPVPGQPVTVRYHGDLVAEDGALLQYGFDAWSHEGGICSGAQIVHDDNTAEHFHLTPLERDGDALVATFTMPATMTALNFAVLASDADDAEVDDNDGLEYHAGVAFPYIGPMLTWNDKALPGEGIVISWETDVPCKGVVAWGKDDELARYSVGDTLDTMHNVPLVDLEPDTTYSYQVFDSTGQASTVYQFHTPPLAPETFTFLVAADMQDAGGTEHQWHAIAEDMVGTYPDASFIMMPGDLVSNDHPGQWWRFFNPARELFATIPSVPALGNHDTPGSAPSEDTTSFSRYFALPESAGTEDYYALDFGNTRILTINTSILTDLSEGGSQYNWIEAQLAETRDADERYYDWVFTQYHHPSYCAGARFGQLASEYREFSQLFDGYVDWAFVAHEHIYQRFQPLRYDGEVMDSYGTDSDQGVGYLVTPAAGVPMLPSYMLDADDRGGEQRDYLAFPELEEGENTVDVEVGYVVVDIDGPAIQIETIGMGDVEEGLLDPHVCDSVSYSR